VFFEFPFNLKGILIFIKIEVKISSVRGEFPMKNISSPLQTIDS